MENFEVIIDKEVFFIENYKEPYCWHVRVNVIKYK